MRKQYPLSHEDISENVHLSMNPAKDKGFGTVETTQKIGISPERLRYWERLGIVKPKYLQCGTRKFRRYSQEDIHRAVLVKALVDNERYTLEGAIRKLGEEGKP
jgi:DNA-binding transcriptional MerR regulator